MSDTTRLRAIADRATPGPWRALLSKDVVGPQGDNFGSPVVGYGTTPSNAEHLATFDPRLVTAMLDVIDAAEEASDCEDLTYGERCGFCSADALAVVLARFREVAGE